MDDTRSIDGTLDPLHDLFAEVGSVEAPAGLELAVLARIAATPAAVERIERPLVPVWAWAAAFAFGIALAIWPSGSSVTWNIPTLPTLNMDPSAPWLLGGMACATLLFGLDSVLRLRLGRIRSV